MSRSLLIACFGLLAVRIGLLYAADPPPRTMDAGPIQTLEFSADSKTILTTTPYALGHDKAGAFLWNAQDGSLTRSFTGAPVGFNVAAFDPTEKTIATGHGNFSEIRPASDTVACLWDLSTAVEYATFSQDGHSILGCNGGEMSIWNAATGKQICKIPVSNPTKETASFSPDGKLVLGPGGKTARLWDAQTGKEVQSFAGHTGTIRSACFSKDGKLIYTASADKTVRCWDTGTGKEMKQFVHQGGVTMAQISPDGKRLVSAWQSKLDGNEPFVCGVSLWDVDSGQEIRRLTSQDDSYPPGPMTFSPDGKLLIITLKPRNSGTPRPAIQSRNTSNANRGCKMNSGLS